MLTVLAACEPEAQRLPFGAATTVVREITSAGGSVSTPAGAAVHFPAGAFNGAYTVSLTPTAAPAMLRTLGEVASPVFLIAPTGVPLARSASLELKLTGEANPDRAWLASVVSLAEGGPRSHGDSRVDLSTGFVTSRIARLGTVAVVIPAAGTIFPVGSRFSAASLASVVALASPGSTASVSVQCGPFEIPCTGTATASQNLLDLAEEAAVLFPAISGTLTREGAGATGSIAVSASLRIRLKGGSTAETIQVEALLEPTDTTVFSETPEKIELSYVRHRISGAEESSAQEEIATLVIPKSGEGASISIRRAFQIRTAVDVLEEAEVTVEFPVHLTPQI